MKELLEAQSNLQQIQQPIVSTKAHATNNPFGDSFAQLNDNEIFGLEFDRIRQNPTMGNFNLRKRVVSACE